MRNSATVRAHGNEVVPHLQQEIVEPGAQPAVVRLGISSFLNTAVLLYRILVSRLVHVGQRRLVDIEKRADFSVVDTLELCLLLFVQLEIGGAVDGFIRIVPVDILVPVIEQERYALLMLPYRSTPCLGFTIKREQVGLAAVPVRMQGHKEGIERTGRDPLRIEPGKSLARYVEPMAAGVRCPAQCGRQQFRLLFFGFFFDLRLFFHIIMLLLFHGIIGCPVYAQSSPAVRHHNSARQSG